MNLLCHAALESYLYSFVYLDIVYLNYVNFKMHIEVSRS
jgi:hypothetical protein